MEHLQLLVSADSLYNANTSLYMLVTSLSYAYAILSMQVANLFNANNSLSMLVNCRVRVGHKDGDGRI